MKVKNQECIIVTYRYMWLTENNDNLKIRIVSGIEEEHKKIMEELINSPDVVKAVRVYMHEINCAKLEEYEALEKGGADNEKKKS